MPHDKSSIEELVLWCFGPLVVGAVVAGIFTGIYGGTRSAVCGWIAAALLGVSLFSHLISGWSLVMIWLRSGNVPGALRTIRAVIGFSGLAFTGIGGGLWIITLLRSLIGGQP
ncbi:MAG: hypothetical protein IT462_15205 [Planctomycetes bacterium]|nr:hypothetical protein [Planctomycetota bacterium]